MKLIERIEQADHYIKMFSEWEASEIIIDDTKAFWCLNKPGSQYQKVCLYRDGPSMFVYGDYGQFTFDSMTWSGSVYNLQYDNIGYQMEKLNYDSKQTLYGYDSSCCEEDIIEWVEDKIRDNYDYIADNDEELDVLIGKVKNFLANASYFCDFDVVEFCKKNDCSNIENLLIFAIGLLENTDEYDWISHLRIVSDELEEFEDAYDSSLWKAGKRISQRYFICMYALQVCGEKLKEKKGDIKC